MLAISLLHIAIGAVVGFGLIALGAFLALWVVARSIRPL